MSHHDVTIIARSVESTNIWLKELADELGVDDRNYAYGALRGVLHALRDRLTVDEAAQLAAQLPTLIRGVYYEEWDPSRTPSGVHDVTEFLHEIERATPNLGDTQAAFAATAVMRVLERHVSSGEIDDVLAILPGPVRDLLAHA